MGSVGDPAHINAEFSGGNLREGGVDALANVRGGGENLDAALKRMDEAANLVDIDLSNFESKQEESEDKVPESQEEASSEAESSAEVVAEVEAQSDSDSVGEEE